MQEPEEQPVLQESQSEMPVKVEEIPEKDAESDVPEDENDDEAKSENFEGYNGTGRTVTLQMLLAAKILQPGKSTMTIEYLGQKFIGDLLPDGKIKSQETENIFLSPSAWAMSCKRIINPDKKSGCGWASVRYKGKKLDAYKAAWLRKCALLKDCTPEDELDLEADKKPDSPPAIKRSVYSHNTINNRNVMHDANTLIEAVTFGSLNKLQPFLLTITSSALLLADLHCHLTLQEVCGYFGGSWDINSHTLAITKTYPCKNTRHDRKKAAEVEQEIQQAIQQDQLILVGWYHSHPKFQAEPTLRDCDSQLDYQIKMRGASEVTYTPCVGYIFSPYFDENATLESVNKSIWVVPPPENRQSVEYGRPMTMQYTVISDTEIPVDVRAEIQSCIEYYSQFRNELIEFPAVFKDETTYIEKLKTSLYTKFPANQDDKEFWNWLCGLLNCEEEPDFIPPKSVSKLQIKEEPKAEVKAELKAEDETEEGEGRNDDGSKTPGSELKVLSLQEQLCIPPGLNMNPTRLCSPLATPTVPPPPPLTTTNHTANTNASVSGIPPNNLTHTATSSPRDSPITIPSNSASPAKFEIPVRASPSPAKSDTSSNRTRNSPAPSPGKFSISDISRNSPSVTPNKYEPHHPPIPMSSNQSSANDLMAASLASLAGQLPPNFLQNSDLSALFQSQTRKDYGNSSLNQLAAAAAKVGNKQGGADSYEKNLPDPYANPFSMPGTSRSSEPTKSSSQSKQDARAAKASASNSYKTKLMKELDDLKNDPIKISELMRSPEYAALLLQQAEALGATTLGTLGFGADFSFLGGPPAGNAPPPPSSKKQQQQQQQAQSVPGNNPADYAHLLQASKLLGYDAYMQQAKTSNDLNNYLQQQMAMGAAINPPPSSSGSSKKQQQQQHHHMQQQASHPDYTALLQTYSKLFDTSNSFGKNPSVPPELSALLAAGVGGSGSSTSSSSSSSKKQKQEAAAQQQQQNDMINQLLQADKAQSELNALLYHQNKAAADLNALFAQPSAGTPSSTGSSSSSKNNPSNDPAAYYNQLAQEKMQDYAAFFQQHHGKYGIPDPLSKSTLAANNLFMSPSALLKLQQESLNAMMMKPPKSTSSSSSSSARVRESSASPASERLTPTKSNRESPATPGGIKYNFSAVDLAISSVPSNTPSPSLSDGGGSSSSSRRPANTPPVDLSRLYPEPPLPTKKHSFSSIADLAAPPPAKIPKTDDILNLSSNE